MNENPEDPVMYEVEQVFSKVLSLLLQLQDNKSHVETLFLPLRKQSRVILTDAVLGLVESENLTSIKSEIARCGESPTCYRLIDADLDRRAARASVQAER